MHKSFFIVLFTLCTSCISVKNTSYSVEVVNNAVNEGLFEIPQKATFTINDSIWYGQIHQTVSEAYLYTYQIQQSNITAYRYYLHGLSGIDSVKYPQWVILKGNLMNKEILKVKELSDWKEVNAKYPKAHMGCMRFVRRHLANIDQQIFDQLSIHLRTVFQAIPFTETGELIFVDNQSNIMGIKCGEKRVQSSDNSNQYLSYIALYNFISNEIIKVNVVHYSN